MSERIVRVNELLKREISLVLRQQYGQEAVMITITEVDTSPDLRNARVYYSVLGDKLEQRKAGRLFAKIKDDIRHRVSKVITLKYLPKFEYFPDYSIAKGMELIENMEAIEEEDKDKNSEA